MNSEVKLCLCAILRNEEHNVRDMLASFIKHVDFIVIIDTGSTDQTFEILTELLKESKVQHLLLRREWQDFASNRSQCLEHVPNFATHVLFLDGDERLKVIREHFKQNLSQHDICMTRVVAMTQKDHTVIKYPKLYRFDKSIHYVGTTHEQPAFPHHFKVTELYDDAEIIHTTDNFDRPEKFERDLKILLSDETIFQATPGRREYYIGQCYLNLGRVQEAITWFKKRTTIDGNEEERWHAVFMLALCYLRIDDTTSGEKLLWYAYQKRSFRAEPLDLLALLYDEKKENDKADKVRTIMKTLSFPKEDRIGINPDLYK